MIEFNRRSIRLQGYDYSLNGVYFVTIVTQNRKSLFGNIINGMMVLNEAGLMVQRIYNELPIFYNGFQIDVCQIMTNHIHIIIIIDNNVVGVSPCAYPCLLGNHRGFAPTINNIGNHQCISGNHRGFAPTINNISNHRMLSLHDIVHRFKSMTTNQYIKGVHNNNWMSFDKKLWQRNYYDRIIRDEKELNNTREYIVNNPLSWENDENNIH
jgi:REP element-mobilizing transposase RayT